MSTRKEAGRSGHLRVLTGLTVLSLTTGCGSDSPTPVPTPTDPVPTTVELLSGDGQLSLAGMPLPDPVLIRVRDQEGLPIAAVPVSVRPSGEGRVTPDRPTTGFDGTVTVEWTLGEEVGEQTLRFDVQEIPTPVVVTAEATRLDPVDVLRVDALPGGAVGALASGRTPYGDLRDYSALLTETEAAFGDFRAGAPRSELAVLAPGGTPRLVADPWTDGIDEIEFTISEPIEVPLTVRVLQPPFEATRQTVEDELEYTAEVFSGEGLGIVFTDVEIVDATGLEETEELREFVCSDRTALEAAAGHDDDRLNVYYVTSVDGSTSRGQSCIIGGNFVAMASFAGDDLLSHEIGHMFGLFHVDDQPTFTATNVMHSASNVRRYLTEGQIFRAHWNTNSSMGGLGLTPGELTRTCGGQYDPTNCPTVNLRLFDDVPTAGGPARLVSGGAFGSGGAGAAGGPLEQALLRRCSAGEDPGAVPAGVRPDDLLRVYRDPAMARGVREEALRLLVLSGAAETERTLDDALSQDPETFGPVVRWGREMLRRD